MPKSLGDIAHQDAKIQRIAERSATVNHNIPPALHTVRDEAKEAPYQPLFVGTKLDNTVKRLTLYFLSCYLDFLKSQCSAAFHFQFSPVRFFSACLTCSFSVDLAQANLQSNWKLKKIEQYKTRKNMQQPGWWNLCYRAGRGLVREVLTHKIQFLPLAEYFLNQKMHFLSSFSLLQNHMKSEQQTWNSLQGHYKALAYIWIRNRRKKIKRKN